MNWDIRIITSIDMTCRCFWYLMWYFIILGVSTGKLFVRHFTSPYSFSYYCKCGKIRGTARSLTKIFEPTLTTSESRKWALHIFNFCASVIVWPVSTCIEWSQSKQMLSFFGKLKKSFSLSIFVLLKSKVTRGMNTYEWNEIVLFGSNNVWWVFVQYSTQHFRGILCSRIQM